MMTILRMEENENTTKIRAEPYTPGQCNAKGVSFNQKCTGSLKCTAETHRHVVESQHIFSSSVTHILVQK